MIGSTFWEYFISYLPYRTPLWLIWFTGLILSIHFRQKNPKKFGFLVVAFSVLLVGTIGTLLAESTFSQIFLTLGKETPKIIYHFFYWFPYWTPIVTNITAWIILVNAIFNRKSYQQN